MEPEGPVWGGMMRVSDVGACDHVSAHGSGTKRPWQMVHAGWQTINKATRIACLSEEEVYLKGGVIKTFYNFINIL